MTAKYAREIISENRTLLMGLATLWIILHHTQFFGLFNYGWLNYFVRAGELWS